MLWLSRKDSRSPAEHTTPGAVVVRTPEDALRDTNVRVIYHAPNPPPASPPLPPLPLSDPGDSDRELPEKTPRRMPKHQRPPSPTPSASSLRPSLKSRSSTAVEDPPLVPVPPLPTHIPLSAPVAPFAPVLLSTLPLVEVDPSRTIVVLETSTATYKSTLATLSSRPSYLADYLAALPRQRYSHASSVYSTESSDDAAQYDTHAVAQTTSTTLHVFLDRPSAPYAHILAFLRTPSVSPEYPCTLPRAVQLSSLSNSTSTTQFNAKLDALLEVRDETAYLGLDSLQKLCNEEIRQRLALAPRHTRGTSHASVNTMMTPGLLPVIGGTFPPIHSRCASVHSLHTLTEHVKGDEKPSSKDALARVSGGSESADDEGTDSLPVSASPSPVPSPNPSYVASRYHKDYVVASQPTSKVPPHSASSSPGQTFTRPKLHKKSESAVVVPTRPPMVPNLSRRSETKTGGRVAGHHYTSSSVVGTGAAPPGWI